MSHHRQMAVEFLDTVGDELAQAEKDLSAFLKNYDPSLPQHVGALAEANVKFNVDSALFHMANAWSLIVDILARLPSVAATELDSIRRLIHSPRDEAPESLLLELAIVQSYAVRVAGAEPSPNTRVFMDKIQAAWRGVDFAEWHIIDAIREEVYSDPNFGS